MKMQIKLEGNLYLFKCEQCNCILSATVPDVTGFGRNALTTLGLIKKMSGKNTRTIYMKIQEVGNSQTTQMYKEKEMSLEDLNELAARIGE